MTSVSSLSTFLPECIIAALRLRDSKLVVWTENDEVRFALIEPRFLLMDPAPAIGIQPSCAAALATVVPPPTCAAVAAIGIQPSCAAVAATVVPPPTCAAVAAMVEAKPTVSQSPRVGIGSARSARSAKNTSKGVQPQAKPCLERCLLAWHNNGATVFTLRTDASGIEQRVRAGFIDCASAAPWHHALGLARVFVPAFARIHRCSAARPGLRPGYPGSAPTSATASTARVSDVHFVGRVATVSGRKGRFFFISTPLFPENIYASVSEVKPLGEGTRSLATGTCVYFRVAVCHRQACVHTLCAVDVAPFAE